MRRPRFLRGGKCFSASAICTRHLGSTRLTDTHKRYEQATDNRLEFLLPVGIGLSEPIDEVLKEKDLRDLTGVISCESRRLFVRRTA